MSQIHSLSAQIYYEDTDHSGAVYYANYLKYFERAREAVIGVDFLVDLWENQQIGFAVYKAELTYHEAAKFGDILEVRSTLKMDGKYRIVWHQDIWRPQGKKAAVNGRIELVCLKNNRLTKIPEVIIQKLTQSITHP